jgi:predicted nucleotidyltransferase
MITPYLISTNDQKILRFFLLHPKEAMFEREISRRTRLSPSSTNHSLKRLYKAGILNRRRNGKMCYYSVDTRNPYLREFKILNNLLLIEPVIERLKNHSHKIVLFGSWAEGTDTEDSDIDLFIVSSEGEDVRSIVNKFSYSSKVGDRKIQAVIMKPEELLKTKDRQEGVFLDQVDKGKVLWEREIHEDIL